MALTWIPEHPAHWDEGKARLVGRAPVGTFDSRYGALAPGTLVPGSWWRVDDDGRLVGYGWLDVSWGDAEILLATDPAAQGRGVGTFILEHLDAEARKQGLNYLTNIVRPTHPEAGAVTGWLTRRGFRSSEDGRLLRPVRREG